MAFSRVANCALAGEVLEEEDLEMAGSLDRLGFWVVGFPAGDFLEVDLGMDQYYMRKKNALGKHPANENNPPIIDEKGGPGKTGRSERER